jgi:hypothetical protein
MFIVECIRYRVSLEEFYRRERESNAGLPMTHTPPLINTYAVQSYNLHRWQAVYELGYEQNIIIYKAQKLSVAGRSAESIEYTYNKR